MHPSDAGSFPINGAPRGLSILGSTGSIGTQTLDIVRLFPEKLRVRALTAHSNAALLAQQALEFRPECVALGEASGAAALETALAGTGIRVLAGVEGLNEAATLPDVETVVAAVVGVAGLEPVLAAIRASKTIALANKETLVVAGALVNGLLEQHGSTLIPVDSEHSAIFQCLVGEPERTVESIVLTASGGPFRTRPAETFDAITRAEALRHPNWSMGSKITIDSATMMNKGLEVIEAHWLFHLDASQIEVLVHPQSIIHSMDTFADGSTKPIEQVELGDWVVAADPTTGESGARGVTDIITGSGHKTLVELTIDGQTVTATGGHPFWVDNEARWVEARELTTGDMLLSENGTRASVDSLRRYFDACPYRRPNLTERWRAYNRRPNECRRFPSGIVPSLLGSCLCNSANVGVICYSWP